MGQRHNRRRTRLRSRNRSIVPVEPSTPPLCFCDPIPTYPAPTWHHGYAAWGERERRLQVEEADKLETEQCRLFGGVPGDDVNLCYRMLEYFGGLDYIDS